MNKVDKIIISIYNSLLSHYSNYRITISYNNNVTIHNHIANYESKVDIDNNVMPSNLLSVCKIYDEEISEVLNSMKDNINAENIKFNAGVIAEILEPGNIITVSYDEIQLV